MQNVKDQIRQRAEDDLEAFIRLVHPMRLLGSVHCELIQWWGRQDAKSHQLVLLPRDHMKSALVGYRVAWTIVRNPAVRVLYISSTANLAVKQLKFIKDILESKIVRQYWPDLVHPSEGKREKWSETEISVDHPLRKAEAIRDPTVFAAGLTTTVTGMHCDIAVLDDVVVFDNAYTEEGREKTFQQYGLLSSIEGSDSKEWVVGTRYLDNDLYGKMLEMQVELYDGDDGSLISSEPLYEVFQRQVESRGDGTGEYLWPLQKRYDGKTFGFNQEILARKKAQYSGNVAQFYAQYYNNPNSLEASIIKPELFQYYDRDKLSRIDGKWFSGGRRLNVFAAVDFAFSLSREADYTSIVVVGVDGNNSYYVLDIERFRTNEIREYFQRILRLHQKWDFRKIRAEVTVAQEVIVKALKSDYIRPFGLSLSIDEFRPTRAVGTKEERMNAILHPKYQNKQIYHYYGGSCQVLEEELLSARPAHDDVKDALANAIDIAVPPSMHGFRVINGTNSYASQPHTHSRFGGVA